MKTLQNEHNIIFEMCNYKDGPFQPNTLQSNRWNFIEPIKCYRVKPGQKISYELLNVILGKPQKTELNKTEDLIQVLFDVLTKEQEKKVRSDLIETDSIKLLKNLTRSLY